MLVQYSTVYSPAFPGIPDRDAVDPDIPAPVQSIAPAGDAIIVNSASFRTGIAPGSFATAFGTFPSGSLSLW
jgi:hypothetical protein